jgi:hypothetical protein
LAACRLFEILASVGNLMLDGFLIKPNRVSGFLIQFPNFGG